MPAAFSRTTRSLDQESGGFARWLWAAAALLLALWLAWFFFGRVTLVEVSQRARLEVRQAAHPVTTLLAGRIAKTSLALGQVVARGDVLVELDATSQTLHLREEQERQRSLAAQLLALKSEIAARQQAGGEDHGVAFAALQAASFRTQEASAAVAWATEQERRLREESASGGVAQVEALQAAAELRKLTAARDALDAEARRLSLAAQLRMAEQRALVEALQRTLAALQGDIAGSGTVVERLRLEIEHQRVRAPVAGRIGEVAPLRAGEVVAAGQKLATVVPAGELMVVAEFEPSAALGKVRPGQTARLRLDGFPWAQYGSLAATVTQVAGELREQRIRVELTPAAALPGAFALQHGLPGAVEVDIEQVAPAVLALRAAGLLRAGAAP